MQEIEIRFLEVNPEELEKKLLKIGAKKISDVLLEEWLYSKPEWKTFNGRVCIRKEGDLIQVAYKETRQETSKGNLEIEFSPDTLENAFLFVERMGVTSPRHQEKRRIHFTYDKVSIDIDFWPLIPAYVEIEGTTLSEISTVAEKLGFNMKNKCELDALHVYKEIYGIDISQMRELVFE